MLVWTRNEPYSLQSRGPVRGVLASTLVLACVHPLVLADIAPRSPGGAAPQLQVHTPACAMQLPSLKFHVVAYVADYVEVSQHKKGWRAKSPLASLGLTARMGKP